jgi:hypothetical protein
LSYSTFAKGKCWVAKDRESKIASRKVANGEGHVLFLNDFFVMTVMTCMFVNLWNKRAHSLMTVHGCKTFRKLADGHPNFRKEPRKSRERFAKRPRKMQWASPPVPLQSLHASGDNLSFSSLLSISSLLFSLPFLLLRWADEVCEETVDKHTANARLNLSHVTTGFPLSPRKVRERGFCSMGCAKATVVAAKVKRKDSRKTPVSTKS